jgi:hypothetical protein
MTLQSPDQVLGAHLAEATALVARLGEVLGSMGRDAEQGQLQGIIAERERTILVMAQRIEELEQQLSSSIVTIQRALDLGVGGEGPDVADSWTQTELPEHVGRHYPLPPHMVPLISPWVRPVLPPQIPRAVTMVKSRYMSAPAARHSPPRAVLHHGRLTCDDLSVGL